MITSYSEFKFGQDTVLDKHILNFSNECYIANVGTEFGVNVSGLFLMVPHDHEITFGGNVRINDGRQLTTQQLYVSNIKSKA